MKRIIIMGILAVLLMIPGLALGLTYDFNDLTPGFYTAELFNANFTGVAFYNESGIDFSVQSAAGLTADFSGRSVFNTADQSNYRTIARFTASPINYVSVTLGDENVDTDILFLIAYDSSSNPITGVRAEYTNPSTSYAGQTLSVTSPSTNIAWVAFGGYVPGSAGVNSVVWWDNFTFEQRGGGGNGAAVPEPATMLLLGTGLLGLAGFSRWKFRS